MLLPNLHYSSRFYLFSHDEKGQSSSLPESLAWDEWRLPVADARVCARQAPPDPYGLSRKQEHNHKKSSQSIE